MTAINDSVFAKQDQLARRGGRYSIAACRSRLHLRQDLSRFPGFHLAACQHSVDHLSQLIRRGACRTRDAARMHPHVPFLDTARDQRTQRREVLRKPDGRHDFGKFPRRPSAAKRQPEPRGLIRCQSATDDTDFQRYGEFTLQITVGSRRPPGQRRVTSPTRGIGMRTGFQRAPVVSSRNGHRINAVHHTLVVGCRPMRVHHRYCICIDDTVADLVATDPGRLQDPRRIAH